MEEYLKVVGKRFQIIREHYSYQKKGSIISQKDLAAEIGTVHQSQLSKIEMNCSSSFYTIMKVVDFYLSYGYNANWIFASDNSMYEMVQTNIKNNDVYLLSEQVSTQQAINQLQIIKDRVNDYFDESMRDLLTNKIRK